MTTPAHAALLSALDARAGAVERLRDSVHCADWRDLLAQLPAQSVDMVLSDMPYGLTSCIWDQRPDLDIWWQEMIRVVATDGLIVLTASQPFTSLLVVSNLDWFRYEWIWDKRIITGWLDANRKPLKRHESILVFSPTAPPYNPQMRNGKPYTVKRAGATSVYGKYRENGVSEYKGQRYPTTIIDEFGNQPVTNIHPTEKPLELFEYLVLTYTRPGDLVLDPFVGSGTTALAARNIGRHYIVGDNGTDERTGRTWADVTRARLEQPWQPRLLAE